MSKMNVLLDHFGEQGIVNIINDYTLDICETEKHRNHMKNIVKEIKTKHSEREENIVYSEICYKPNLYNIYKIFIITNIKKTTSIKIGDYKDNYNFDPYVFKTYVSYGKMPFYLYTYKRRNSIMRKKK